MALASAVGADVAITDLLPAERKTGQASADKAVAFPSSLGSTLTDGGHGASGAGGAAAGAARPLNTNKNNSRMDPKRIAFLRLNRFLLRTHFISLFAALREDDYLEFHEKDKISILHRYCNSFYIL